jgi:hypothetical protein
MVMIASATAISPRSICAQIEERAFAATRLAGRS